MDGSTARTPEELETLLEDSLVLRDPEALSLLFDESAVFVANDVSSSHGSQSVAQTAMAVWEGDHNYVASPKQIVLSRDIALIVVEGGINVARRGSDGAWRYAIVVQSIDV